MVTHRKPSVLTPKAPRAKKPKPEPEPAAYQWKPQPGTAFRVRITVEDPFGGFTKPTYTDDLFLAEEIQQRNEAAGLPSVFEVASQGVYTAPPSNVPRVAELGKMGLAHENPDGKWTIEPAGYERIFQAMRT